MRINSGSPGRPLTQRRIGMDRNSRLRRSRGVSAIRVRARPGDPGRGILIAGHRTIPVALGRAGIRANKREGDGATPAGRFCPLRLWWRADRGPRPSSLLPLRRIGPDIAWCEDPAARRADALYDLIIEID